tara:strand:- start:1343 stop:2023 length:681 start_codon:yes stop_codon:yes gene_type:complete
MKNQMNKAARKGRGGDSIMGHLAPGEMVVPPQILNKYPKLRSALASAFMENKVDPRRYLVGSKANSINPDTGTREFGLFDFLDDVLGWEEGNPAWEAEQAAKRAAQQTQEFEAEMAELAAQQEEDLAAAQQEAAAQLAATKKQGQKLQAKEQARIKKASMLADRAMAANSVAAKLLNEAKGLSAVAGEGRDVQKDSSRSFATRLARKAPPRGFTRGGGGASMSRPS